MTFAHESASAGLQRLRVSLTGSARAMRAAPAAGQPFVLAGSCRRVVEGRTLPERRGDCPIRVRNDGTCGFWINTDRAAFPGEHFASIAPRGDGTATGDWNGIAGATPAQAFPGEDFRMGAGGCGSNARAIICAAH